MIAAAGDVAHHPVHVSRVADVDGVVEVEVRGQSGKIFGVAVHAVVPVTSLGGAAVAATIGGDHPEAMTQEEQKMGVSVVGRERPAVAEHDRLATARSLQRISVPSEVVVVLIASFWLA